MNATYFRPATCWINKINVEGTWTTFYTLWDAYQWAIIYMSVHSIKGETPSFTTICQMLQMQREVILIQTVENPIQIILYLGHDEPPTKTCSKGFRPADVAMLLGWNQDDAEDSESDSDDDDSQASEIQRHQEIDFAKSLCISLNNTHIAQNTMMED